MSEQQSNVEKKDFARDFHPDRKSSYFFRPLFPI